MKKIINIEKIKNVLPSMIHEDGEKHLKKYNIFFHYVDNKLFITLEDIQNDIVVPYIEEDKKILKLVTMNAC